MIDKLSGLTEEQRKLLEKKLRSKKKEKLKVTQNIIVHNPANSKKYPISYNQESIWLVNRLYEQNTIYNIGGVAHIRGTLNPDIFEEGFQNLIRKHDILRTIFYEKDGQGYAKVLENVNFHIQRVDFKGKEEKIVPYVEAERDKIFDIENEPAYRVSVIKLNEEEWVIVLIIHHLLSDGTSTQIIFRELIQYYEAHTGYQAEEESSLSVTYGDFSVWQNMQRKEQLRPDYWIKRLENASFGLDFFEECTALKQMEDKSVRINIEIEEKQLNKLNEFAKERKLTLFSVLLGSFYLTLYKYSGQSSLFSGILTSGRENTQIRDLIGCFINVVPFQMDLDREQTVEQYLAVLYQQFLTDFQHKDELMTYENKEMEYQILFSYEEDPENDINVKGLSMSFEEVEASYCRSEMELELNHLHGMIRGWLNYRESLFDPVYMKQFVKHYVKLLSTIVENPSIKIKDLEVVTGEERKLIESFNPETTPYERNSTIQEVFYQMVDKNREALALLMDEEVMTYEVLDASSNQVANYLISKGVQKEDKIALICERGFDLIVSIMGILKAGAAYVPIDYSVPDARKKFILKDSGAKFLLADLEDRFIQQDDFSIPILIIKDSFTDSERTRPFIMGGPESAAYLIYTSGTTGTPKGVLVTHKNVLRTVRNTNYLDFKENDRLLQLASYAFDASVFDIFYTLLNGASIALVSTELLLDIPKLVEEINKKNITVMFITTALFNAVVDINLDCLKKVRKILFGGERASVTHVRKAFDVLGTGKLVNMYGPTESTVYATYCEIDEKMFSLESIPIGKPISNTSVFIRNKDGNITPIGVTGEIIIGGEGIAAGYLERPDLTKEKFIEDENRNRYYKTGDIGKWTEDGDILYCGRVDDQVKYRGFRIELGEIETAILSYEEIERAYVIFENDQKLGSYLCAYVVAKETCSMDMLKENLRKQLPSYMIPNYFITLGDFPLNQNGKVDKKKLPKPKLSVSIDFIAPKTEQEQIMAEIWKEVLGIEKVGITDDFFELGGHSIKVAKMCALIQKRLDRSIPFRIVFKHPTIKELCDYMNGNHEEDELEKIARIEEADRYEASQTQKRMVFAFEMDKNSISYNIPFAVKIDREVQIEAIKKAVNQLIAQHEILRTKFQIMDGSVYQLIEDTFEYPLEVKEDNRTIDECFDDFIKPFDLTMLPLFRLQVVKHSNGTYYLMGDFHHVIFDGVSMEVFLEELSVLYRGGTVEKQMLQYKDYAAWNNKFLQSDIVKKQGEYWKKEFAKLPQTMELPLDYQRPESKTGHGEIVYFYIEEELTEKLRKAALAHKTTLNVIMMSVYHIFLKYFTGSEDVVVGMPVAGRKQESVQRMLGMFLNTLALRSYPDSDKNVAQYIEEVKEGVVNAFDNQDYPFERLVDELDIPRAKNRNPLFDTIFIMQNGVSWNFDFGKTRFQLCDLDYKSSKFDMQMEVYEEKEKLKCLIAYADDLFERSTVELFIDTLKKIADWICVNDDKSIGELTVEDNESMELLEAFSDDLFE